MTDDEYYVFARSDRGNVIRLKVLQQAINDSGVNDPQIVEVKGDRVTPHTFRKTFASRLVMNGVAIQEVSKMLGHSSVRMTEKSYAFLAPDAGTEKAARLLDSLNRQNAKPVLTLVNQ
jgi:integrase